MKLNLQEFKKKNWSASDINGFNLAQAIQEAYIDSK
jgi:hypothetical protein